MLDWCSDDQPVWLSTRNGRILAVPYPQELNDSNAIVARHMSASDFADVIVDQFDEMREQCAAQPLVMGVALHAYIVGPAVPVAAPAAGARAHRAHPRRYLAFDRGRDRAALRGFVAAPARNAIARSNAALVKASIAAYSSSLMRRAASLAR